MCRQHDHQRQQHHQHRHPRRRRHLHGLVGQRCLFQLLPPQRRQHEHPKRQHHPHQQRRWRQRHQGGHQEWQHLHWHLYTRCQRWHWPHTYRFHNRLRSRQLGWWRRWLASRRRWLLIGTRLGQRHQSGWLGNHIRWYHNGYHDQEQSRRSGIEDANQL